MAINLDAMKQDTDDILTDWGETLTVKRASQAYDGTGRVTQTWTEVADYTGDWQPVSGEIQRAEAGRQVKSKSQVIVAFDADILAGDRIYRSDDSYEIVNYTKKHEDHMTVFLTDVEGEAGE